jgi:hypothetical protein
MNILTGTLNPTGNLKPNFEGQSQSFHACDESLPRVYESVKHSFRVAVNLLYCLYIVKISVNASFSTHFHVFHNCRIINYFSYLIYYITYQNIGF